jgi:hypothetical protein
MSTALLDTNGSRRRLMAMSRFHVYREGCHITRHGLDIGGACDGPRDTMPGFETNMRIRDLDVDL